jgi:hypothetical protein
MITTDEVMDLLEAILRWIVTGCTFVGVIVAALVVVYLW